MQPLPRTITHPQVGDTVTFLKTAAETNGTYTLVEVVLLPGGGNDLHYHVDYIEIFEVLEGVLGVQCGKAEQYLNPGDTVTIPKKMVHRFFNKSSRHPVKFRVTIQPARHFEVMLRIAYGLAVDGKTNKKGLPHIWHLAILFQKGESYLPGLPLRIQKSVFGILARIARIKGVHRELYKYYKSEV
ncbi:cupin domain-containing protein [Niabella sp. CC-SYL272]|uniref:cupin domain-containing protein n=1 Tax=Niabella agricola TaxID=2891571 RepID=UPI001F33CA49|nr:cupin domain-containing protein [Niabella agricola]MCF3108225.1 cupin domain-containing protein [Niabella agricola]